MDQRKLGQSRVSITTHTAAGIRRKRAASGASSGLRFVSAFEIDEDAACTASLDGRRIDASRFRRSRKPFDFKRQDTLDLHIALGVGRMVTACGTRRGPRRLKCAEPVDHGFCRSIMRDPNGTWSS